jgi:hypothetical protein
VDQRVARGGRAPDHGRGDPVLQVGPEVHAGGDGDSESLIRKTIRELGDELDPLMFWQVHRSTIVNVHAIDSVIRDERGNLSLRLKNRPSRWPSAKPTRTCSARCDRHPKESAMTMTPQPRQDNHAVSRRQAVALLSALGVSADALGQDAVSTDPRAFRVVVDNASVRVLEFKSRPGLGVCGQGLHYHPAHVTVS